jgi:hypothetical protein
MEWKNPISVFQDERGTWSAARMFLAAWLLNAGVYIWLRGEVDTVGVILTFYSAVGVPLIVWTAGPRIAQYLGPSAGAIVQGVGESAKSLTARIQARRDPEKGIEDSK